MRKGILHKKTKLLRTVIASLCVLAMIAGIILLQYSIDSSATTRTAWREAAPFDTGKSILDVLGGMRQTVAAYLWTKTDEVYHRYGINLYENTSLYPYYRLVTLLDPHFTMAYYFASYMLFRLGKPKGGFDLALEGLRYNPDSSLLQRNLAEIYLYFKKDPRKARYHCLRALAYAVDEDELPSLQNLLRLIDEVLAGKKKIPEIAKATAAKLGSSYHQHQEEGEYCPECERGKHR